MSQIEDNAHKYPILLLWMPDNTLKEDDKAYVLQTPHIQPICVTDVTNIKI